MLSWWLGAAKISPQDSKVVFSILIYLHFKGRFFDIIFKHFVSFSIYSNKIIFPYLIKTHHYSKYPIYRYWQGTPSPNLSENTSFKRHPSGKGAFFFFSKSLDKKILEDF